MTGDGYPTSAQARRAFAQADAMRSRPGYAGDDWTLQRVVRTLAMWSVCIDRMAESGPAFLRSEERQFRDHPEFGQGDPLADIKAQVDVIAYVTVGDMLLQEIATLLAERAPFEMRDPPEPWVCLMSYLDGGGGSTDMRAAARWLDLVLVNARHRVAAHWRKGHTLNFAWQMDGTVQVVLVDPTGRKEASRILWQVLKELPIPLRPADGDFEGLREMVFGCASLLDKGQRKRAQRALELSGFETYPIPTVVDDVLKLVSFTGPLASGPVERKAWAADQ